MTTTTQTTPALPRHVFFRGDDAADLLLMDTLLLTTEGALPQGCWFTSVFSKTKRPDPIGTDAQTGLPIFAIPVPFAVLKEFSHGMKFPPLLLDMARHVPLTLKTVLSYNTWRTYLEYYGLLVEERHDDDDSVSEPPKKKQKLWEAHTDLPRFVYFKRVAVALANKIKAEHPDYAKLVSGEVTSLSCIFINTYKLDVEGNYTYLLDIPGEPRVDPVQIAYDIGVRMKGVYNLSDPGEPAQDFICACLDECLAPFRTRFWVVKDRNSKAKKAIEIDQWPAGRLTLTPGVHDVIKLNVSALRV